MRKNLGPEQALQKIRQYCAYQERSHADTKDKLYGMGLFKTDVERILSVLI
jgi:regulatory protein